MGLLFAVGNFGGFLLGLFLSMIVKGESRGQSLAGLLFCFGTFVFGFILIYFMKEEKNREKAESESSERRRSARLSQITSGESSDQKQGKESLLEGETGTVYSGQDRQPYADLDL